MFVLAHLSDLHLSPMPRPRLRELAGKRAIGIVNWRLRRRLEHRAEVFDALAADLAAQAADHVAVTGDLVNIALPGEFEGGGRALARLGPPERVTRAQMWLALSEVEKARMDAAIAAHPAVTNVTRLERERIREPAHMA